MDYLLSGSLSYDTILLHEGLFHHRILPESIARLNVGFGIDSAKNEFGGTAGNIAYNASLLGDSPVLVSSLGEKNCQSYIDYLHNKKIDTQHLTIVPNEIVANSWILTDQLNNQITGFYKGAMKETPLLPSVAPEIWHLAPDYVVTMALFAKEAKLRGAKYFFDPGQALPSFLEGGVEHIFPLREIIKNASGCFVNEYEAILLEEKLGISLQELIKESKGMEFFIKTLGGNGVELVTATAYKTFPVAQADKIVDPTGCGDAFRAGFIHNYLQGKYLDECVVLGAVMGSFAVEESGGQNHNPSLFKIAERIAGYGHKNY